MALIDVVNFNADASCLSSEKWLNSLAGGKESRLCRLLDNYVRHRRKVNLGLTGATIADLRVFNPEALERVNAHPEIFSILQRSFSHDLSPLRSPQGFLMNLRTGMATIGGHLQGATPFYLQNEQMIRNQQVEILAQNGIEGIFIHPERYDDVTKSLIPKTPFFCEGTSRSRMLTIPVSDHLTLLYLCYLHREKPLEEWTRRVGDDALHVLWRDGESALLFPGGVEFEGRLFAAEENDGVGRFHLVEMRENFRRQAEENAGKQLLKHFPQRKLDHWLSDFKMIWILQDLSTLENEIEKQSPVIQRLWLMAINSDIPASSEKTAPRFKVHSDVFRVPANDFTWNGVLKNEAASEITLLRSERYFEGEVFLDFLHRLLNGRLRENEFFDAIRDAKEPHLKKIHSRVVFPLL